MTLNILLIIIIVLLVVGIILQLLQIVAIMSLPDHLLDAFWDESEPIIDVKPVDVISKQSTKGFRKTKTAKSSKSSRKRKQTPAQKDAQSTTDIVDVEIKEDV